MRAAYASILGHASLIDAGRVIPNAMMGEILTLPIRLSVRAASLTLKVGEQIAGRGFALAAQAAGLVRTPSPAYDAPMPQQRPAPPPPPEPAPPIEHDDVIDLDAPPEEEPIHVSEEPELAAEVAEPGAEEGAGAEVRIDEPWPGYARLSAKDIVARVVAASDPAELAAIQLYESANQRRQTVISAVERQLALSNRRS